MVLEAGDIALDAYGAMADLVDRLIEYLLAARRDDHLRPLFGEQTRGGQTNAAVAAGDHRDLTL
ncbi:hypothetical protein D3C84_1297810 [compost metagenome]